VRGSLERVFAYYELSGEGSMNHRADQGAGHRLLDVPAAAAYLGVSPRFIRRLVAERRLAFVKLGRHLRLDVVDLDHFIKSGRVEPFEPTRRSSRVSARG